MTPDKSEDIALWRAWKQAPSPQNLEALIKQLMPLIRRETSRWGSLVPPYVLENEAKKLTIKACESYNPMAGTALSTHVINQLQKLSRTAYKNQSSLSVPEQQRLTFNRYSAAQRHLEDLNGRKPSLEELGDYLAIKPKKLQMIVENVGKRELIESGEGPAFVKDEHDDVLHLAFADMTPLQKRIFEMRTGYNGVPVAKDAKVITKALNITQGQLSYQINAMKPILERAQRMR
jgi:DNA-directed RNA polymerase specialized sigma subunit